MKFLVITNAPTLLQDEKLVAYAPYVAEMNIWFKYVDNITILSPTEHHQKLLTAPFNKQINSISVSPLAFTNFSNILSSVLSLPSILISMFAACKNADHIHLRCPGTIGLLGCLVQVCFPKKTKTTKYAGNWEPKAIQPLSYKFQKWLLSNTFLTKNMTVLVYGNWKNQTKNIKSFFTATYASIERQLPKYRSYANALKFVFVGTLVEGKRPLFAIQIIEKLNRLGYDVSLDLYGDGILKSDLQKFVNENNLDSSIKFYGNQKKEVVKDALNEAHFLILPSKSEGWPKAIAEAMFFGVIPISTSVSCVPYMLDYGKRGILITTELKRAVHIISDCLADIEHLKKMASEAANWSQNYTLDAFEDEIIKLLKA